jgi:hypothetical protein
MQKLGSVDVSWRASLTTPKLSEFPYLKQGVAAGSGRYCCKSLWARVIQIFLGRRSASQKSAWGTAEAAPHSTSGFPNRVTPALNRTVSHHGGFRADFRRPPFSDFCNNIGSAPTPRPPAGASGYWGSIPASTGWSKSIDPQFKSSCYVSPVRFVG